MIALETRINQQGSLTRGEKRTRNDIEPQEDATRKFCGVVQFPHGAQGLFVRGDRRRLVPVSCDLERQFPPAVPSNKQREGDKLERCSGIGRSVPTVLLPRGFHLRIGKIEESARERPCTLPVLDLMPGDLAHQIVVDGCQSADRVGDHTVGVTSLSTNSLILEV